MRFFYIQCYLEIYGNKFNALNNKVNIFYYYSAIKLH